MTVLVKGFSEKEFTVVNTNAISYGIQRDDRTELHFVGGDYLSIKTKLRDIYFDKSLRYQEE